MGDNPFTRHPNEVGMTYGEHLKFALSLCWCMKVTSAKCFIHAIFPFMFETGATKAVQKLSERLNKSPLHELGGGI